MGDIYRSVKVKDGENKFDSKKEHQCFKLIEPMVKQAGLKIGRTFNVPLLPSTSYFGAKYMAVDFWVGFSQEDPLLLIEYKGGWVNKGSRANLSLLKTRLHIMQLHNPVMFGKLLIIGPSELDLPNMASFEQIAQKLKGFRG